VKKSASRQILDPPKDHENLLDPKIPTKTFSKQKLSIWREEIGNQPRLSNSRTSRPLALASTIIFLLWTLDIGAYWSMDDGTDQRSKSKQSCQRYAQRDPVASTFQSNYWCVFSCGWFIGDEPPTIPTRIDFSS
jgi:hypothetical protein